MLDLSNYSCDKCAREFSRHCKHCYHTADKAPTRFKKKKKTGVQTPEFRKPTPPPPPPTSGSNAVKPNPNYVPPVSVAKPRIYRMNLGDLDNWVKTIAQIGDVAYCYDSILDHRYIYCYLKPDDNPSWMMMQPKLFEKYFKAENKGDEEMVGTINCTYSTPCGWCTKWDKKCDKKIGEQYSYSKETITNQTCKSEEDHEWYCCGMSTRGSHYRCIKCGELKIEPYTVSTSNYYKGE